MLDEALEELDTLPASLQEGAEVLQMRLCSSTCARNAGRRRWRSAGRFAGCSRRRRWGSSTRRFACTNCVARQRPRRSCSPAPPSLLGEATYHYNLGCYDAALGNLEDAQAHLRKAFKLDGKFRTYAKTDPDLKPVWGLI